MTAPDIAAFLRDRIADTERDARAAAKFHPSPWRLDPEVQTTMEVGRWLADARSDGVLVANGDAAARHVARHDPAHVLAWCTAIRAAAEVHKPRGVQGGPPYRWTCTVCDHAPVAWEAYLSWPCATLGLLAAIWADHPAFDQSWRV